MRRAAIASVVLLHRGAAIRVAIERVTSAEAEGYFRNCGHGQLELSREQEQLLLMMQVQVLQIVAQLMAEINEYIDI